MIHVGRTSLGKMAERLTEEASGVRSLRSVADDRSRRELAWSAPLGRQLHTITAGLRHTLSIVGDHWLRGCRIPAQMIGEQVAMARLAEEIVEALTAEDHHAQGVFDLWAVVFVLAASDPALRYGYDHDPMRVWGTRHAAATLLDALFTLLLEVGPQVTIRDDRLGIELSTLREDPLDVPAPLDDLALQRCQCIATTLGLSIRQTIDLTSQPARLCVRLRVVGPRPSDSPGPWGG